MRSVGHHRGHLTADEAGKVDDRLPSGGRQGGNFAVARRATSTANEPFRGATEPLQGGDRGTCTLDLCLQSSGAAGDQG